MLKKTLVFLVVCFCFAASALAEPGRFAGRIFTIDGSASVRRGADTIPVTKGLELQEGDELVTGEPGRVAVELPDGSYIRVASGSTMKIIAEEKELGLFQGALHFLSHAEKHPVVKTQQVTASIRGTEFTVVASKTETTISMFSGTVAAQSANGTAQLAAGQGAHFRKGKAPEMFAIMASDRSVQWSMFVPFTLDGTESPRGVRAAEDFRNGEVAKALASLAATAAKEPCGPDGILRARMLLSSGDPVNGASALERCTRSSAGNASRGAEEANAAQVRKHVIVYNAANPL
jgi:hypothetical protein